MVCLNIYSVFATYCISKEITHFVEYELLGSLSRYKETHLWSGAVCFFPFMSVWCLFL